MLSTGVRIWVAFEAVDMRLSFDGLAARVQHGKRLAKSSFRPELR